eukprot:6208854-Pleurochrysis_carterae.AAC.1
MPRVSRSGEGGSDNVGKTWKRQPQDGRYPRDAAQSPDSLTTLCMFTMPARRSAGPGPLLGGAGRSSRG